MNSVILHFATNSYMSLQNSINCVHKFYLLDENSVKYVKTSKKIKKVKKRC